ncbi:rab-GTPase-TBC domain-containing protein [Panaeolus papilionaceus]|nr:rab-GTPase-TBC domain-containing protein [Panaeolus papilionaceus]
MEAHRARELKWIVPTATLTAAQARKSKKVKKLVHEGVPASVRYPVWSFLTDGKARCVPGVYRQLCDREFKRAGVLGDIERDASKILSGIGARADTREGVVSLLQAYLNMVPDVVYDIGLIHITSTLLLLAPEEDAFWIFVSIMDTHIRPYFSPPPPSTTSTPPSFPVSMALEVDSMLFAKALEHNEPQLARRILNDIGIPKEQLLGGWMRSLFVRALPGEVAVRVWDVFLYEGLPFLMRTALALTSLLKRPILELPPTPQSQRSLLNILFSPASSLIPAPEVFLALAWGVKFKDDDFKKTREKEVKEREKKLDSGRRVANAGGLLGTLGASRGMGISLPRI